MKRKITVLLVVILLVGGGYLTWKYQNLKATYICRPEYFNANINVRIDNWFKGLILRKNIPLSPIYDCFSDKSKKIELQQVNNLGYTFYIGQIDYPNTPIISDDIKNQITKMLDKTKFPKSLLKKNPIVIVNSLAIESGQYIKDPSSNLLADASIFGPDFLSEGGKYAIYDNGMTVIYINKIVITKGLLTENLVHEFGHAIATTLTDEEWATYYQLRGIPAKTEQYGKVWNESPQEDFAEVYRSIFTGSSVGTIYGPVGPQTKEFLNKMVDYLNT